MTIDITPEAVERMINDLWDRMPASLARKTETMVRALSAALTDYQKGQTYRYIGKDGLPILARDLEDQRDAAIDALTASLAETAANYAIATHALDVWAKNLRGDGFSNAAPVVIEKCSDIIRALTPADSKAALDRMIAEAEERGMRKAAALVWGSDNDVARWERGFLHDRILAAIPKGTPHE